MIEANATPVGSVIRLEYCMPDTTTPQIRTAANMSDARRIVYFENRRYMLKKLTGWLRQRMYSGDQVRTVECAKLLVLLGYYEHVPFLKLCQAVHAHRSAIEAIAPGPRSKFYNHYQNIIVPLLNDAAEMEGSK